MNIELLTYNGGSINDGSNYHSTLLNQTQAEAESILLSRTDNVPVYAGKRHQGKEMRLVVAMQGTSENLLGLQIGTLNKILNVYDRTPRELLVQDAANANKQWYVNATVVAQPEWNGRAVEVALLAADPVWRSKVGSAATATFASSPGTLSVTPAGNQVAYPRITLTPTGGKGTNGYSYKRWVPVYNRTDGAITDAWNLTDNGSGTGVWNTATVVAGSMQADGDDLRVYIDNTEAERWLDAVGSAATKVWAVVPLSPKIDVTLAAIGGTGTTGTITVQDTRANLLAMRRLPESGILLVDSEAIQYGTVNRTSASHLSLVVGARGIRGTSGATHAAGATAHWIEHDVWILYGNSTITGPWVKDAEKPVFDLNKSDNVVRSYTQFADEAGMRAGGWKPGVLFSSGKQSYNYSGTEDSGNVDPAESMGMAMTGWMNGTRWQSESARLEWRYANPIGATAVAASGEKMSQYITGTCWPTYAAFQRSHNGVDWATVWNQAKPGTAATWQAWDGGTATFASTEYLRFWLAGAIAAKADNCAKFEIGSASIWLNAANVPVVSLGAQQANYHLDGTITNLVTGDALRVSYPMALNNALTIDTDKHTISYADGTNALGARTLSSARQDWLALQPGTANPLKFEDATTSGLQMIVSWEDRTT